MICNRYSGCTEQAQYQTGTPGIWACYKHRPSAREFVAAATPTRSVAAVMSQVTKGHERLISFCVYCGVALTPETYTRDHVIPRARGGSSAKENLAPCCKDCNNSKGPLTASEYLAVRGDNKARKAMIAKVLGQGAS
jgi:5-methylcytosine-specific restriction endonuclease McrA